MQLQCNAGLPRASGEAAGFDSGHSLHGGGYWFGGCWFGSCLGWRLNWWLLVEFLCFEGRGCWCFWFVIGGCWFGFAIGVVDFTWCLLGCSGFPVPNEWATTTAMLRSNENDVCSRTKHAPNSCPPSASRRCTRRRMPLSPHVKPTHLTWHAKFLVTPRACVGLPPD